ncbi:HNH endonuclease signature motif containing protein [Enterobacter mori]|uniref:HNH endonuclease n=1 Tax=Enterobacter mori TaxID=539813 RepID=UPI002ED56F2F|nr:HNH endonuclease signature motif containing protein [Enterobacter mori]
MRILSKPEGIEELTDGLDLRSSLDAILALDEPIGIVNLRKKKDELISEMIKYHYEMSQNRFLSHNSRKNLAKYKTPLEWIYLNPSKLRKTDYIESIRRIYAESGLLCPYCGVSPCRTLDHYYNKALLPQFSFLPENLIPCCGDCNRDKGSRKSFSKWKRFVNPFYDDFSLLEKNEPLIYIIFKENPRPNVDMEYVVTANHNLSFVIRKQINYHIRTVKISLWHNEAISNSFWRNARDLIGYKDLLSQRLVDNSVYNVLLSNFIQKNDSFNYDWEYIVRYSLVKLKVNGWIYDSRLLKLT